MYNLKRRLTIISIIFGLSLFVSLPGRIPINFSTGGLNINKEFVRPSVDISFGNISIKRDLELKLGLDLIGGSHLVFEADTSALSEEKKKEALSSLEEVVSRRVNMFGVSEPSIQLANFEGVDRIIVDLPGVADTREAVGLVGQTAQLSFAQVTEEELLEPTDLTGADVFDARVAFDNVSGKPVVSLEFTSEGANKFEELTGKNVGKPIPILLDSNVVSAPVVQEVIIGGKAQISGEFTLEEAQAMVIQINAGSLPVPLKLVEERIIGPTLGAASIDKSVKAGLVGIAAVAIFMTVMYGRLGLVANLGLFMFGVFTLALYKLIPVVLTLPGIAGFILSVGMAVDSNILVFERFREEKRKGSSTTYALENSFEKAWDSIKDANIATLVTAFVLANPFNWQFLHMSGPVRGFALTLAFGIVVSLFTGIFVSRTILRFIYRNAK